MSDILKITLLANLAEEAGEVAAIACKTIRFGPDGRDPTKTKYEPSNIMQIGNEIGNLLHIAGLLGISQMDIENGRKMKAIRLKKFGLGCEWGDHE